MRQSRALNRVVAVMWLCLLPSLSFAWPKNKKQKAAPESDNNSSQQPSCTSNTKLPQEVFYVGGHGQISNAGRTMEGPVCVAVYFNAISTDFVPNSATTYSTGPEPSPVILTGAASSQSQQSQLLKGLVPTKMPAPYDDLRGEASDLLGKTDKVKKMWEDLEDLTVQVDALLLQGNTSAIPKAILGKYDPLKNSLADVLNIQNQFLATDLLSGSCPTALLSSPQQDSLLQRVQDYRAKHHFKEPGKEALVQTLVLDTQSMACGGPRLSLLTTQLAGINAFSERLQQIGLFPTSDTSETPSLDAELLAHFVLAEEAKCGNIFNQSSSTVYSATIFDQSGYLDGKSMDTTGHPINNLITVTCASPIAVSVGVEFSTIDDLEYAIKKSKDTSSGATGTTSVSQFQEIVNSEVHPLPVALAHARFWDSPAHKYAAYFTAGASGNIQSQSAGGSSAEFLIGGSLAFFRTVFFSAGLHIGTQTTLGGGFKPGDNVPTDITDISQVPLNKSYHPGFGFAVTFTKP